MTPGCWSVSGSPISPRKVGTEGMKDTGGVTPQKATKNKSFTGISVTLRVSYGKCFTPHQNACSWFRPPPPGSSPCHRLTPLLCSSPIIRLNGHCTSVTCVTLVSSPNLREQCIVEKTSKVEAIRHKPNRYYNKSLFISNKLCVYMCVWV